MLSTGRIPSASSQATASSDEGRNQSNHTTQGSCSVVLAPLILGHFTLSRCPHQEE
jgi:hypothetical protein